MLQRVVSDLDGVLFLLSPKWCEEAVSSAKVIAHSQLHRQVLGSQEFQRDDNGGIDQSMFVARIIHTGAGVDPRKHQRLGEIESNLSELFGQKEFAHRP